MKIILISKPTAAGYLSENATNFLRENGFKGEGLEQEYPTIDLLKRNDRLLIEAVEKYSEEMPYFEVIDVPMGRYKILSCVSGQEGTVVEVLVKDGCYWNPYLAEQPVQCEGNVKELDISVRLMNQLLAFGVEDIYDIEKYTKKELEKKITPQRALIELEETLEGMGLSFAKE